MPQEIIGGNKVISAADCLIVTLRFLATGKTFQSMSFQFHITDRGISYIVKEVYLKVPSTDKEWLSIAEKSKTRWHTQTRLGIST